MRIAAVVPNGDVTYYLTDQVDSVKVVVDDDGRPVTRTEYYPYGDTWFQEGDTKHAPKYNSQELDKESGLYFYNARYYDAGLSRFVTADSVVPREMDTQSWNRYSYVINSPIVYKDPDGKQNVLGSGAPGNPILGTVESLKKGFIEAAKTVKNDVKNIVKTTLDLPNILNKKINEITGVKPLPPREIDGKMVDMNPRIGYAHIPSRSPLRPSRDSGGSWPKALKGIATLLAPFVGITVLNKACNEEAVSNPKATNYGEKFDKGVTKIINWMTSFDEVDIDTSDERYRKLRKAKNFMK